MLLEGNGGDLIWRRNGIFLMYEVTVALDMFLNYRYNQQYLLQCCISFIGSISGNVVVKLDCPLLANTTVIKTKGDKRDNWVFGFKNAQTPNTKHETLASKTSFWSQKLGKTWDVCISCSCIFKTKNSIVLRKITFPHFFSRVKGKT